MQTRRFKPRPAPPPPAPQNVRDLVAAVTGAAGPPRSRQPGCACSTPFCNAHADTSPGIRPSTSTRCARIRCSMRRWPAGTGSRVRCRDHNELFAAHLLCSPFPDHREHGEVLLQYLRPYQVVNVVKYCKDVMQFAPRRLRSAVQFYLRRREAMPGVAGGARHPQRARHEATLCVPPHRAWPGCACPALRRRAPAGQPRRGRAPTSSPRRQSDGAGAADPPTPYPLHHRARHRP